MGEKDVGLNLHVRSKEAKKGFDNVTQGAEKTKDAVDKVDTSMKNLGKTLSSVFKNTALYGWVSALKEGLEVMIKATKAEAEYVESMNLLQVSYENNTKSADKLIRSMNQLIGLDPSGLTKQLGTYRQFSSAMGIAGEKANLLSENLLKLQTDISSLYNIDFAVAGRKLQSAIAGQTRPVRELGADITEASLQQELYNRGIDASVKEMNRASKTVLIYLTLERQLSNANGDASKTVNSLANQVRIFREQLAIAGRQIGAVFIPILKSILPYANAILMVFNEIMNMLLALLGVDVDSLASEFGIGTSSVLDLEDSIDGLSSGLGGATKNAKALKQQLRGFDKLNNLTTPTPTSASGGAGGGIGGALSGVDSRLLDALKEYDLHLDSIHNKAVKIRDSIMEWLGFAKNANGEWEFSQVKLGTILALLAGGMGIKWALGKILTVMEDISIKYFLPLLEKLPIIKNHLNNLNSLQIWGTVAGLAVAVIGIVKSVGDIFDVIKDPSWTNFNDLIGSISLAVAGVGLAWASLKPTDPVGWIMGVVGALGYLITSLIDTRSDAEKLRDAQEQLNKAQEEYAKSTKENLQAFESAKKARENLIAVAKKQKKSEQEVIKEGEILYELLGTGEKTVSDLTDAERELYTAYTDYIDSNKKLQKSNEDVTKSFKTQQKQTIETLELEAKQADTVEKQIELYQKYANQIQKSYDSNAISADEYVRRMAEIYNALDEESREVFLNSIPKNMQESVVAMSNFSKSVQTSGNWLDSVYGDKKKWTIKVDNSKAVKSINDTNTALQNLINKITKPLKMTINATGNTSITGKAEGGFVDSGQLFMARENGLTEYVGQFGNKTAVANNDQIVEGIEKGVARGMQSVKQSPQPVVITAKGDASGLLNFITFEQEQRNRQYGL